MYPTCQQEKKPAGAVLLQDSIGQLYSQAGDSMGRCPRVPYSIAPDFCAPENVPPHPPPGLHSVYVHPNSVPCPSAANRARRSYHIIPQDASPQSHSTSIVPKTDSEHVRAASCSRMSWSASSSGGPSCHIETAALALRRTMHMQSNPLRHASRKSGLAVSEIHAVESASQTTKVRLHASASTRYTKAKSRSMESPDQGEHPECANDQRAS